MFVEPIQGEAGVLGPPPGYLAGARAACDAADVLLVVNEIQSSKLDAGLNAIRAYALIWRPTPLEIMAHGGLTVKVSGSPRRRPEREENLCATGSCGVWRCR